MQTKKGIDMKEGWEMKKLGEVYSFKNGVNFNKHDKNGEGILTIDVLNMYTGNLKPDLSNIYRVNKKFSEEYKLKNDDILIVRSSVKQEGVAWTTYFNEIDEEVTFCGFIIRGRANIPMNAKYAVYFMRSTDVRNELIRKSRKSTITNINQQNLSKVNIPIAPLPEQKAIVTLLDTTFAKIDQAKANIEKNIANAKELFQSKLNEIFSQRDGSTKEIAIKDLTEIVTKGSSPKWQGINYIDKPGTLFITSQNVGEGKLLMKKKKYLEKRFNEIQKKSILKKGDVLTNIVGASIGRTAIYDLDELANINQAVCIMRCEENLLYNYYLMHMLNSPYFKTILHDNEVNNARANLSLTFFKNLMIPLPNLEEQKNIVKEIRKIKHQVDLLLYNLEQKRTNLDDLKKSLLQKAFSGELT